MSGHEIDIWLERHIANRAEEGRPTDPPYHSVRAHEGPD